MLCEFPPKCFRFVALAAFFCLGIGFGGSSTGCGNRSATNVKQAATDSNDNPLADALRRLEKDTSANACREVLQTIDSGIPLSERPADAAPQDFQKFGELARLTANELAGIARKEFTSLDADYLSESLLLRDVARSLDLESYPPEIKVAQAFAWVCRQVTLIDQTLALPRWYIDAAQSEGGPPPVRWVVPAPPWWVLEDGSGCVIDRAAIFLALLRQLNIDGCLIGPPELFDSPSFKLPAQIDQPLNYAPVRAVGARVGKEILLFDPRLGRPIAAPDRKKIASLAQLRANPEASAEWLKLSGLTANEIKTWEVFLCIPPLCAAPRILWLDRHMAENNRVVLAADPIATLDRFRRDLPAEVKCRFWNTPGDERAPNGAPINSHAPMRVLATYNIETSGPDRRVSSPKKDQFRRFRFPIQFIPPPNIGGVLIKGRPFALIEFMFHLEYDSIFLTEGSPRDLLLRGQFRNALAAVSELDQANSAFRIQASRETKADLEKLAQEWSAEANKICAAMIAAERSDDAGAQIKANADEAEFRRSPLNERMRLRIRKNSSLLLSAEAKYLTALIVHERAERIQGRVEQAPSNALKAEAAQIWENAADNWRIFLSNYAELSQYYKFRFDHARQLQQRAMLGLADAKK